MGRRVLVSGGGGFLGSHLVDRLLADGHEVWALDNWSTGNPDNLDDAIRAHGADRLRITSGTVAWPGDVEDAYRQARPHLVYHLAAQVDVTTSVEHPQVDFITNVTGTVNMLAEAERPSHGVSRFVFVSSAAIFGDADVPTSLRLGPDGLGVAPISPYGAGKAAAMLYVDLYNRRGIDGHSNMCANTVVFSNLYGPRQRRGVIATWARALLAGEPVTLHGDGGNVRDYLHVDNAVEALVRAAQPGARGAALVGTGVGTTDRALSLHVTAEVSAQLGRELPGERLMQLGAARPGDIRSSVFPRHPLATTGLADGLKLTVEAIRKETA